MRGKADVQAESVRLALQFVQTGNAEAGLVSHSVAEVPEVRQSRMGATRLAANFP